MLRKIYDAVIAENDLVSRGTALVQGAATFQSDVTMEQNAAVQGNQDVGGDQTVDGDVVIEDSSTGEQFTFRLDTARTPSELVVVDDGGAEAQRIPVGDDLAELLANGGVHELNVAGLSGVLQDRQDPQNHGGRHTSGSEDALDAGDLSGGGGAGGQMLYTDGASAYWDSPPTGVSEQDAKEYSVAYDFVLN
jgi:hypothetical protein